MEIVQGMAGHGIWKTTLQWGHNFFVMEIVMAHGKVRKGCKLQWGHNFFVMEIRLFVGLRLLYRLASMGP